MFSFSIFHIRRNVQSLKNNVKNPPLPKTNPRNNKKAARKQIIKVKNTVQARGITPITLIASIVLCSITKRKKERNCNASITRTAIRDEVEIVLYQMRLGGSSWAMQSAVARILTDIASPIPALINQPCFQVSPVASFPASACLQIEVTKTNFNR